MQTFIAFASMLTACLTVFFLAPHHRKRPASFQACTLWQIYFDVFRNAPTLSSARKQFFFLLLIAGIVAAFFPAGLVLMIAWLPRNSNGSGGAWFVAAGALAAIGAAVNLLLILVSHMNFAFGGSSSTKEQTIGCWLIPLTQFVFGILSAAVGFSSTCAHFASRIVLQ